MTDVRRFTGQVFTVYDIHTLVSITLMYTVMVGGMTFDVFNLKTDWGGIVSIGRQDD